MTEDTERTEDAAGSGSRQQRLVSYPHAYSGLCIQSEKNHQTVNVHFVQNGQVFYGKYADEKIDDDDHCCIGLYRIPEEKFNGMIGRAVVDECLLYTLVSDSEMPCDITG